MAAEGYSNKAAELLEGNVQITALGLISSVA